MKFLRGKVRLLCFVAACCVRVTLGNEGTVEKKYTPRNEWRQIAAAKQEIGTESRPPSLIVARTNAESMLLI